MTPEMLLIPAGDIRLRDEGTKTNWTVRVEPFLLASVPVTRELYLAVTSEVPSSTAGPRTPVTEVSWLDSVAFCNRLSLGEGRRPYYTVGDDPDARDVGCDEQADGYRLPTEAQWEHACRAGSSEVR